MSFKNIVKQEIVKTAICNLQKCAQLIDNLKKDLIEVQRLRTVTLFAISVMDKNTKPEVIDKAKKVINKLDNEVVGAQNRLQIALITYNKIDEDISVINEL